jgi:membrane protein DedA with SNARE-associated domain
MFQEVQATLLAHPWPGLLLVVVMAVLEYIVPPVPGDSTMLFACFLAGTGALSLPAAIAACVAGSIAGAAAAYAIGSRIGHSYFLLRSAWAREELARLERGYRRYGPRLLVINRFLPGVRGVFLYGAGIGRLGWRPVMIYSTVSNVLWVALLAWGGARLGGSWDEVSVVFRRYAWGVAVGVTIYAGLSVARARRRRRTAARPSS